MNNTPIILQLLRIVVCFVSVGVIVLINILFCLYCSKCNETMIITNKTGSDAKPIPANLPPLGLNSI